MGHTSEDAKTRQDLAPRGRDKLVSAFFISSLIILAYLVFQMASRISGSTLEYPMDFQIFHKVGELFWQGAIGKAYTFSSFRPIEISATGYKDIGASWAYPPQFDLVAAALGAGPTIPMYVGFMLVTFGSYLASLARLGTGRARWALAFAFPAMVINISSGQNGFMTGALAGWFAAAWLRNDAKAGIPLGLMVIKPHLMVGLAVLTLIRRRFGVISWTAVSTAVSGGLATVVLGPDIWGDFLHGAREASSFLQGGDFPFYRMTSLYATLRTFGIPFGQAMALHAGVAALALLALYRLSWSEIKEECILGVAMLTTLLISPYVYDYDFAIFGVGVALLAPTMASVLRTNEILLVCAASWIVCGWGVVGNAVLSASDVLVTVDPDHPYLSLPGLIYPLLVFGLAWVFARRAKHFHITNDTRTT